VTSRIALGLALALVLVLAAPAATAHAADPPAPPEGTRPLDWAAPPPAHPELERAIGRQRYRQERIHLAEFLDTLGIAPGMSVLDVGAGPGYASFLFAERLRGSGEVWATDIRQDFVDYINAEAKRRGLGNLTAAVVSPTGLDGFYLRHRYDLVLLSNVYHCLDGRVAYFSGLRGALRPGARLVLVLYNQAPLLLPEDFLRLDELARALATEPPDSPFSAALSGKTRRVLAEPGAPGLREALAEDFNRMLTDPLFYRGFYRDSYFLKDLLSPTERDFANWLVMTLAEAGAFECGREALDERELRAVITLNRIFLVNRFGAFLAQGGRGLYLPAGDANRQTSKYVVVRELDAAGYRLVSETRLSPYFDAVVMAPKAP